MIKANWDIAPPGSKPQSPQASTLSKSEILGNSFIFLFAGHETTANNIHYSIVKLAMAPVVQRHMQADIDGVVGDKPKTEFSYFTDMPRLYNSMVGAVLNEELRLIPAIPNIPKETNGDQTVSMDGSYFVIPDETFVHLNVVGTNRNPRYWLQSPDEFIPERWLPKPSDEIEQTAQQEQESTDGLEIASFETTGGKSLVQPVKGSYIPFSEGMRACPGRRFAQVESTAALSAIFQKYSVELDVSDWASDMEVEGMGKEEKRVLYQKAIESAERTISRSEQTITVQMKPGERVPLRFVARGKERFADVF